MSKQLSEILKDARENLSLSQKYVAKQIDVHPSVISAMELGWIRVTSEELKLLSELYGIPLDDLVYGSDDNSGIQMDAMPFLGLTEKDKKEIINLVDFKKRLK